MKTSEGWIRRGCLHSSLVASSSNPRGKHVDQRQDLHDALAQVQVFHAVGVPSVPTNTNFLEFFDRQGHGVESNIAKIKLLFTSCK